MTEPRTVVVTVRLELDDLSKAREDAADMAWEHAKSVALGLGYELGSPEHVDLHKELSERYEHSVEHLMFFMKHAFSVLTSMFDTGYIRLNAENGPLDDSTVCQWLGVFAQGICRSYMHLMAGYELLWPTNEMLPQYNVAEFYFTENEINMEEQ